MKVKLLRNVTWPFLGGSKTAHAPYEYDLPDDVALKAIADGAAESLAPVPEPVPEVDVVDFDEVP